MNGKLLLIINPVSGDGAAKNWAYDMIEILSKRFSVVSVYLSRGIGDIKKTVAEKAAEYDAVVVTGGDGSLNELLDGIVKSGASPLLGYVPMGTINDFANSHGISKNVKTALRQIVGGKERLYDVGMLGDRAFSYVAAFGAFTDVAYLTPQDMKSALGKLAYISEATKRLPVLKPIKMTFEVDGRRETDEFIYGMVSNSKTVGSIKFFDYKDDAFLSDGLIEATLVRFPYNAAALQEDVIGLLDPKAECRGVIRLCVPKIKFEFENGAAWTVDGEYGGEFKSVEAGVLKQRIRMIH